MPRPLRYGIVAAAAFLLYQALAFAVPAGYFAWWKMSGRARLCPWPRLLSMSRDAGLFHQLQTEAAGQRRVVERDAARGLDRVEMPGRSFWVNRAGTTMDGPALIAYLFAEQRWVHELSPGSHVRPGDTVVDCGAHVGVFTHFALERGASKVIAIEPEPINIECFRRNFAKEIAAGRVVLVPKGLWSEEMALELFPGVENSGTNSVVERHGGKKAIIPVTTLDKLVEELKLDKVDYFKLDIEGAERHALEGAMQTLKRFRPRVMMDSYHEPDDPVVLPALLRRAHADYALTCGPCQPHDHSRSELVPHVIYYR